MAASKTHNLEVGGSSPPPVTKLIYMEEIEKSKMTRVKKTDEGIITQMMMVLIADNLRGIVNASNEIGIKREDILGLYTTREGYALVYYK